MTVQNRLFKSGTFVNYLKKDFFSNCIPMTKQLILLVYVTRHTLTTGITEARVPIICVNSHILFVRIFGVVIMLLPSPDFSLQYQHQHNGSV